MQLLGKEKLERARRKHHNLFLIVKTDFDANCTPTATSAAASAVLWQHFSWG